MNINWKYKSFLQKGIGMLPNSKQINYFFQHTIQKNLPISDELMEAKIEDALFHIHTFRKYNSIPINNAQFYEFGAGWDLLQPLVYYCHGVEHQTVVDVVKHLKYKLINDIAARLDKFIVNSSNKDKWNRSGVAQKKISSIQQIEKQFGIKYLAPIPKIFAGQNGASFDFISSTNTIEHIPESEVLPLLKQCYHLLKRGGIMSCRIDYQDHYSYFDSNISGYNFLQYSNKEWEKFNNKLQYQNRLRHRDYIEIIQKSGFQIVKVHQYQSTEKDNKTIENMSIDSRYRSEYSTSELAIKWAFWVLRKR